jgi:excisionase family DNA binding protein
VNEPLVDAHVIADRLSLKVSWVREQTRRGLIPHYRLGRYVRYRVSEVDTWLDSIATPGRTPGAQGYDSRRISPRAAGTAEGVTTPKG